MAEPIDKQKARLEAFIVIARKIAKQLLDEVDAIEATFNEQPTARQQAQKLLDFWCVEWAKYNGGKKYLVEGAKEINAFKRFLRDLTAREIAERMVEYLKSPDQFYVDAQHPFGMFVKGINKFGQKPKRAFTLTTQVIGCTHVPRCADDVTHTRKYIAEGKRHR